MSLSNPNRPQQSVQRQKAAEKAPKKKIPAWKILVTVIIMVLSMAIVVCVALSAFGVPLFGGGGLKGFVSGVGSNFEPDVSPSSTWTDDQTGLPVLDGNRKQKVFNFLVVGLNDDTGNNTDTIMLAQYDTGNQYANVVQIPRDTYINASYNFHKINSIFAAGYNVTSGAKAERREAGMARLCEFFESNFAVKIDFSVLVDLSAFENLIDGMGGLKVNVPCDMDYEDPWQDLYIHLRAGEQTLSGYDAMCMVRNRHTYADADYGRMNVQKIFLSALLEQVQQNLTDVNTLKGLIDIAINDVATNLTADNCFYFASQALNMDMSHLRMVTMPTTTVGANVTILKSDAIDVINNYLNVYDRPITEDSFDPKCHLTDKTDRALYETYLYTRMEYDVYTADDVNRNSIHLNVVH